MILVYFDNYCNKIKSFSLPTRGTIIEKFHTQPPKTSTPTPKHIQQQKKFLLFADQDWFESSLRLILLEQIHGQLKFVWIWNQFDIDWSTHWELILILIMLYLMWSIYLLIQHHMIYLIFRYCKISQFYSKLINYW